MQHLKPVSLMSLLIKLIVCHNEHAGNKHLLHSDEKIIKVKLHLKCSGLYFLKFVHISIMLMENFNHTYISITLTCLFFLLVIYSRTVHANPYIHIHAHTHVQTRYNNKNNVKYPAKMNKYK